MKSIAAIVFFLIISTFSFAQLIPKENRSAAFVFKMNDDKGKEVSLSDFKGKVVYMDLWGSWCGPCIKSMPKSETLREKFNGEDGIVFLYVAVNEKSEDKWKAAIEKLNIEGVNLISMDKKGSPFRNAYDTGFVPHYFLIDKEGKMADFEAKQPGKSGLEEDIRALLSE